MLYEIPHLRRSNRCLIKRWFTCPDMDLYIWFHDNVPIRFQLSYNKRSREKAINWDFQRGLRHYLVDTGEEELGRYKQTPILIKQQNQGDLATTARNFLAACEHIDIGVSDFIYARLMEYPVVRPRHRVAHTDHLMPR